MLFFDIHIVSSVSAQKLKCPARLGLEPSQLGLTQAGKFQLEFISRIYINRVVEFHGAESIYIPKIPSFLKRCCSVSENKVLQLMSAWLNLERFPESTLFFVNWRLCKRCFKNEWTLVVRYIHLLLELITWIIFI